MISKKKKLKVINDYVKKERKKRGIEKLVIRYLPELSCFAEGEFKNLVERQLLHTQEGFGSWQELADPEVLDGAYLYVTKGIKGG